MLLCTYDTVSPTQANCAGAAFNQMSTTGTCIHIVATWNGPQYALLKSSDPTAGLTVTFGNGDACYMNKQSNPRTTTITFACDCDSIGSAANLVVTPDSTNTCNWYGTPRIITSSHHHVISLSVAESFVRCRLATFPTSAGCPVDHCTASGLSGGSIFLILLVVMIPVYVTVGCVYKRAAKGASGSEACPNVEFWRDLPSLVSDGFKFTLAKLSCRKGGSYENMS